MMSWVKKIIDAHLAVTDKVSRYRRLKSDRYFVWAEDGTNDLVSDGSHAERAIVGTTDLYTKIEDDPWREELEAAFEAAGIPFYRNSVQYEEETGYIHTEWVWEVVDDGSDQIQQAAGV